MKITDNATRRQAAQLLAIKVATDEKRAEVERLTAPERGPRTASEIQGAEMLRLNRQWDEGEELGDQF